MKSIRSGYKKIYGRHTIIIEGISMDNFIKTLSLIVISVMIQFCIAGMLISTHNAFLAWLLIKGVNMDHWQNRTVALETT